MSAVTVDLPEVAYQYGGLDKFPVFASTACDVMANVGKRGVNVWRLTETLDSEEDLRLTSGEARSLAAALLAAADASEVQS